MAEQTVITAYPKDNSFKFVWAGDEAVYKSKNGETTVRCTFHRGIEGVDDSAEPYFASGFVCANNMNVILKRFKEKNEVRFALLDSSWKLMGDVEVIIEKKIY